MNLSELIAAIPHTAHLGGDPAIMRVEEDSRRVGPGDVFVCVSRGERDGHDFAAAAQKVGAAALVTERPLKLEIPQVLVDSGEKALGPLCAAREGHPAQKLTTIGITGTNGKTTTSYLVAEALARCDIAAGLLGTISYRIAGREQAAPYTTPTPPILHRALADNVHAGATHVVMEVSSAALAMERLRGVEFSVAAFTNLSQDHLDVHGSMTDYQKAKSRLFSEHLRPEGTAVINLDDPASRQFIAAAGARRILTFSTRNRRADITVVDKELSIGGIRARLKTPRGLFEIESRALLGEYNLANLVTAVAISEALGLESAQVSRGMASMRGVPGRVERVANPCDLDILVDYAHTPDALANVLGALKALTERRLICVFGCGGDRDASKRPQMAAAVARGADLAVVTSDNPRTEDANSILVQIVPALPKAFFVDADRSTAIAAAVEEAHPGDIVLIAGKGHEDYQILGTRKIPFDDREEAAKAAARRFQLSLGEIADLCHGAITRGGEAARRVSRVVIDGRQAARGDLYVAIVGERFDGHDFVDQAARAGASAALVRRGFACATPGLAIVECDDPRRGLAAIARWHRQKWAENRPDGKVLAITGSSGKTTVKAMIAAALGPRVHAPWGSLNNETGVPLTLLGLRSYHPHAVVELGMRGLGQIAYLTDCAQPDIGVVTNIGMAHLGKLGSLQNIARAKAELLAGLPRTGTAVYPVSQSVLAEAAKKAARAISFGVGADCGAQVIAQEYRRVSLTQAEVVLSYHGQRGTAVVPIPGPHSALNAACAAAAAIAAGSSLAAACRALAKTQVPAMRGQVVTLGGRQVLVDCYNANPCSVRAALECLREGPGQNRVAVLGDMLELGEVARSEHQKIGQLAAELGVAVVALGEHAAEIARGVQAQAGQVAVVESREEAAEVAWQWTRAGSWILVKASRGARFERVVDALRACEKRM